MFTGIVEHIGKIESLATNSDGGKLRVSLTGASQITESIKQGDSIAVNGCCLTVVEHGPDHFSADLSGETLRRTSLGEKEPGDPVNLERPLAAGARLGGHFVQGHVDGVGRVTALDEEGENWWLSVRVPGELRRYVADKGSISIEGISLTVARWENGVASIAVIPFTYQQTNVNTLSVGSGVNLEVDILAKYVESLLAATPRTARDSGSTVRLTVKELTEQGF